MKIAQIVCVYPPYAGGIGTSAIQFAKTLSTDHEVMTFTPVIKDAPASAEDKHVTRLKPLLSHGHGALLLQLFCRLNKYDAIYLHYPFFGTAEIVWLYKIFHKKTRLIIHYHMDVRGLSLIAKILSWPSRLTKNCLFNQADKITCGSLDYIANSQIAKYYKNHPNKFVEIPFGVDTEKFKPLDNRIESKIKTILFVGGLDQAHYFKGIDYLLEAASQLPFSNWQLNIAGAGNLQKQYEEQAKDLGMADKVKFLGKLNANELAEIYRSADLFVLPSINSNEAFGIVLLEAMASGVPVIASNLPGVRTVFQNGIEGLTIKPANANDLKEKITKILTDPELQKKMAQAARRLAIEKYSLAKVDNQLLDVWKN